MPKILGRLDHHLGRFHQQTRKADNIGLVFLVGFDQVLGWDFDAQVYDLVSVVAQDDLNQVLADVVHVALNRGQHHLSLDGGLRLLHVGLQMADRELHGLGGLQDLGHDQLVGVELAANLGHPVHQGPVDDLQRGPPREGFVQVLGQPLLGAFDDAQGQPFVQGQVLSLF